MVPPFFWNNHFDLHLHYVGHGGDGGQRTTLCGSLKAKRWLRHFRDQNKITSVASVGQNS